MLSWLRSVCIAAWAPIAVLVLHILLSQGLGAYAIYPDVDTPMHFLGCVAIGFFFDCALCAAAREGLIDRAGAAYHALAVVGSVCAATIAWECAEFLSDRCLGTRSLGGMDDTLLDMLLGISGAVVLVAMRQRHAATCV